MKTSLIHVGYTSCWEEGDIHTSALLNIQTGEITEIVMSEDGAEYETLIMEKISINGSTYIVETDANEFEYCIPEDELNEFIEKHITEPKRKIAIIEKIMENSYMDADNEINPVLPHTILSYGTRRNGNVGEETYSEEDFSHAEEMKKRILDFAPTDFTSETIEITTCDEHVHMHITITKD